MEHISAVCLSEDSLLRIFLPQVRLLQGMVQLPLIALMDNAVRGSCIIPSFIFQH